MDGKSMNKQINIRLDEATQTIIEEMAKNEKRKIAAMARILIEEAIEARKAATNEKNT